MVIDAGLNLVGIYNDTSNTTKWTAYVYGTIVVEDITVSVIYDSGRSSFYGMSAPLSYSHISLFLHLNLFIYLLLLRKFDVWEYK